MIQERLLNPEGQRGSFLRQISKTSSDVIPVPGLCHILLCFFQQNFYKSHKPPPTISQLYQPFQTLVVLYSMAVVIVFFIVIITVITKVIQCYSLVITVTIMCLYQYFS